MSDSATSWTTACQAPLSSAISQNLLNSCPLSWWCLQPSHPLPSPSPVFSPYQHQGVYNESALLIRWPKYWSFSFSISPPTEYSNLISFRIDCFDLREVQESLKSLLQPHNSKASILLCLVCFMVQLSCLYMTTGKTIALTMDLYWQNDVSAF